MKTRKTLVLAIGIGSATLALFSGCTTATSGHRTAAQYIDDGALSRRVNHELSRNPHYKFGHVKASAYKGVIQLDGAVVQENQKQLAQNIAMNVAGVLDVVSNLSVDPQLQFAEDGRGSPSTRVP